MRTDLFGGFFQLQISSEPEKSSKRLEFDYLTLYLAEVQLDSNSGSDHFQVMTCALK